jgi:hypothetical protein
MPQTYLCIEASLSKVGNEITGNLMRTLLPCDFGVVFIDFDELLREELSRLAILQQGAKFH